MNDDQKIWCVYCQFHVPVASLKKWQADETIHWLCDGCDDELLPAEKTEDYIERIDREQRRRADEEQNE